MKEVRQSRQEDLNRVIGENKFLSGALRENKEKIHEEVQKRLEESDRPQVKIGLREKQSFTVVLDKKL